MFRPLSILILLSALLFSAPHYTVRIAVFKYNSNLKNGLAKFPPALKKTVRTYKVGRKTYVHTLPTKNKRLLKKILPAYRKLFRDAYISKTSLR